MPPMALSDFPGPWIPPWYPAERARQHNPWTIPDNASGKTHYQHWCDSLKKGELLRLIAEHNASDD